MGRFPRIVVFCKEPAPGRVKTRLAATCGAERAAELAWAMLLDTLALARGAAGGEPPLVLHDPPAPSAAFLAAVQAAGCVAAPQVAGGLGERLAAGLLDPARPRLALGTDAPDLPLEHLRAAAARLVPGAALFDPADDGGFVLLGLGAGVEAAGLADPAIAWSSATTLADAAAALARRGARVLEPLPGWSDVDVPADLLALRDRLRGDPGRAPLTSGWLERHRDALESLE